MTKLLFILLIGLIFEATGVMFLKKGIMEVGEMKQVNAAEIFGLVKRGAGNAKILAGVLFEALFFGCLIYLLAKGDVSFVWPLTALSFVMTTLAAMFFLHEKVAPTRWAGVVFIMIGAALISYSEHAKQKSGETPALTAPK